jgi:hypothetical protein
MSEYTPELAIDTGDGHLATVRKPAVDRRSPVANEIMVRVKRISMNDESKLHISLEAEHISRAGLEQVKRLLSLQVGPVVASFRPIQHDLFDG